MSGVVALAAENVDENVAENVAEDTMGTVDETAQDDWFLMTSHREPQQTDGLHLAVSSDGLAWIPVNDDQSVLTPQVGLVFRDPSIGRDAEGVWHLVWTIAWDTQQFCGIGYTSSRDLIHWEPQRVIPVMENVPQTEFVWAPELFYDTERGEWMIHWSSSVTGRFPETLPLFNGKANPRIYYTYTKDFREFTPSELLFNPNCLAIDSYLCRAPDDQYYVFVKVDREMEPKRGILMASSPSPTGPYTVDSQMITAPDEGWAEGPSAIIIPPNSDDGTPKLRLHYAMSDYSSAYESTDMKTWTSLRGQIDPPGGYRHGTVVRIPAAQAKALLEWYTPQPQ